MTRASFSPASRVSPSFRVPLTLFATTVLLGGPGAGTTHAQSPGTEVRQLVTFRFLPGGFDDAMDVYREQALPLYRRDNAMRSFRGFREVESPIPLDLVVVSAFANLGAMDASNAVLGRLAAEEGTSIGEIYGAISEVSERHDDQLVEMRTELSTGNPASYRLVALVWYRTLPGEQDNFERHLADDVVGWERRNRIASETGRFLLSDGWTHLRFLGFDSLAEYQAYWTALANVGGHGFIESLTAVRREVILAPVPELSVR